MGGEGKGEFTAFEDWVGKSRTEHRACYANRRANQEGKSPARTQLATVVRDDKTCFYTYANSRKRAKENLHPLLGPGWGMLPLRNRLRYLMPSWPQSLVDWLFITRVVMGHLQCIHQACTG